MGTGQIAEFSKTLHYNYMHTIIIIINITIITKKNNNKIQKVSANGERQSTETDD
jgi:hypothetical protein